MCREVANHKLFVFSENKSKLTLKNVDQVTSTKIKVDGCEINDNSIRCDYLHLAKEIEFFIELKGQDIEHAVEQLIATFRRLSSNIRNAEKKSYIICVRSPLSAPEIQNLKRRFKKDFNSQLEIKSSPFEDSY